MPDLAEDETECDASGDHHKIADLPLQKRELPFHAGKAVFIFSEFLGRCPRFVFWGTCFFQGVIGFHQS